MFQKAKMLVFKNLKWIICVVCCKHFVYLIIWTFPYKSCAWMLNVHVTPLRLEVGMGNMKLHVNHFWGLWGLWKGYQQEISQNNLISSNCIYVSINPNDRNRSEIHDTMITIKLFRPESQMQQGKRSTLTFHTILAQEKWNLIKNTTSATLFFHQWYADG